MGPQLLAIAIGGALGAVLRHTIATWVQSSANTQFPWGTIAVNLLGCFTIGFLFQLFERWSLTQNQRSFIFTGLLGAFTTFSTYGLDIVKLLQTGNISGTAVKLLISNGGGILLVIAGIALGRSLTQ